jgi:hypothetical protein
MKQRHRNSAAGGLSSGLIIWHIPQERHVPGWHQRRKGTAVVVALLSLLLISAILAQQVQRVIADRRSEQDETLRLQTEKISNCVFQYAMNRLQKEPTWTGTTCNLPAGMIHQTNSAAIQISVSQKTLTVTARYPADSAHTCQITRTGAINP